MERIVFENDHGQLTIAYNPDCHSILPKSRRIVLRTFGTVEVFRLKSVRTSDNDTDYIVGERIKKMEVVS